MKKILLFIVAFVVLLPGLAQAEAKQLPSGIGYDQIGQKIEEYYKENEATSAAMETAVFDKDTTIYRGNFGYMDKEKGLKADEETVFEWGSITKLTVWVSAMQLWEECRLDLEADIRTYLPKDFLKNLTYDKAITMLDLMNHQAGFDNKNLYQRGNKDLGQTLQLYPPRQIFEPGTVTAYSNYSTGLAAYVVERISGQSFADYAHQHIFQPLGMDRTAMLPDLSDNAYVQAKRREIKSYYGNGELQGEAPFALDLYPAGKATGTLSDLQKFAQALLGREKLFKRPETWTSLYTASLTYPGTDETEVAHGFWSYAIENVGNRAHQGGTPGFSSLLSLDLKSGTGLVIMVNQSSDSHYTNGLLQEMVFGSYKKANQSTFDKLEPGFYRMALSYHHGPLSLFSLLPSYTAYVDRKSQDFGLQTTFWTNGSSMGRPKIAALGNDALKLTTVEVLTDYGIFALLVLAMIYALLSLLGSLISSLYHWIGKKPFRPAPIAWKLWQILTCGLMAAFAVNLYLLAAAGMRNQFNVFQQQFYLGFAVLGLGLVASQLYLVFAGRSFQLSRGSKILTVLTSLSALAVLVNIFYWSLYQFWIF